MKFKRRFISMFTAAVIGFTSLIPAPSASADTHSLTWPAIFTPYTTSDGKSIFDKAGEAGISPIDVDITSGTDKGIGNLPSVYHASDADNFYVRLRLKGNPYDRKGGFLSSVWMVHLAGSNGNHLATVGLNGKSPSIDYVYIANADGSNVRRIYETANGNTVPGTRIVAAENGQYFLDFQVPIAEIAAATSNALQAGSSVKLYFASSKAANLSVINKDGMDEGNTASFASYAPVTLGTTAPSVTIDGGYSKEYNTTTGYVMTGVTSHSGVTVRIEGTACTTPTYTGSPTVAGDKTWSLTLPACITDSNGTYTAVAEVSSSGKTATYTQEITIKVNTTNSITIDGGAAVTTSSTSRAFSGTAVGNGKVHLYIDGNRVTGTSGENVGNNGRWSSSSFSLPSPSNGKMYVITAKFSDTPNSPPLAMATQRLTYTSAVVVTPTVAINTLPTDGSPRPTISGTSTNADRVELEIDGVTVDIITENPGTWSYTPEKPLSAGNRIITAKAKTNTGNTATDSKTYNVTLPSITIDNGDPFTTNDNLPTITGRTNAANGSTVTVQIKQGETVVKTGTATLSNGVWRFETAEPPLADGMYTVTASVSGVSASQTMIVDTTTTVSIDAPAHQSMTDNRTPTISGGSDPGATIDLQIDPGTGSAMVVSLKANGSGIWSYTPTSDLAYGLRTLRAIATDAHGNDSAPAESEFTITQGQVAAPTANPASGSTVANGSAVTLSTTTGEATIHYTTDGSDPDTGDTSGTSVTITGNPGDTVTVKAIAVKSGMVNSVISTFTYTLQGQVAAPTANPASGSTVANNSEVTLKDRKSVV